MQNDLPSHHGVMRFWRGATLAGVGGRRDIIRDGTIVTRGSRIVYAGPAEEAPHPVDAEITELDGRLVTPAPIDCHTHAVYAGNRANEFERRLDGASYQEISAAGGGIMSTVRATRSASVEELIAASLPRIDDLIAEGVSTIEIKSGYGLDVESELRMLEAAQAIAKERPVRVRTTYLAAHTVPEEYKGRAMDYIAEVAIPGLHEAHARGLVDAVDGFCESIAFSPAELAPLFREARTLGLPVKLHAEQLSHSGGIQLATAHGAVSVDHVEYLDEQDAEAMARSGTVAVLLPGAFYFLREKHKPNVDFLRRHAVPMAVATDCNPGSSPLTSILLAMNMAATLFGMTVEECLAGVTRHASVALGLERETGSLAAGTSADFVAWNCETPAELVGRMGGNPLHSRVFKGEAT